MTYEASLLGSHAANMATYALYIIVIFLVNNFYDADVVSVAPGYF